MTVSVGNKSNEICLAKLVASMCFLVPLLLSSRQSQTTTSGSIKFFSPIQVASCASILRENATTRRPQVEIGQADEFNAQESSRQRTLSLSPVAANQFEPQNSETPPFGVLNCVAKLSPEVYELLKQNQRLSSNQTTFAQQQEPLQVVVLPPNEAAAAATEVLGDVESVSQEEDFEGREVQGGRHDAAEPVEATGNAPLDE